MERSDLLIFKRIIMILNAKIVKSEIEQGQKDYILLLFCDYEKKHRNMQIIIF